MPANYVHKMSLVFALLGRPAGPGREHHELSVAYSSGPTVEVEESGGGKGSNLRSPASIKDMKKEGKKGAGLPVSRGEKRKEMADDRKKAKQEKRDEREAATTARFLAVLEKPQESQADIVLVDYMMVL
ncbi:unnamed protein product, partial [Pylaiella littoralis]